MDASTVISIGAFVVSLASLGVAAFAARESRRQNLVSQQPILQLSTSLRADRAAGVVLQNVGNGPARIIESEVWLDDELLGPWDKETSERLRADMNPRPSAVTFAAGSTLGSNYDQLILSLGRYDPIRHEAFATDVGKRLNVWIRYESIDGQEQFPPAELRPGRRPVRARQG